MFSKRLVALRKAAKLSQYELANRLGFSRGKLANYEQGTREPDFETLKMLANFFNVSTDYLLGRTDVKYQFNPEHEYNDFDEFKNDPILLDFLQKDLKAATPEEIEKLRAMYKIIKNT